MEEHKSGKSKLGVVLVAILGILGLGALSSLPSKGVKTGRMIKTVNAFKKTIKPSRLAANIDSNLSPSKVISYANDGQSAVNTTNTNNDANEWKPEEK